MMKIHWNPIISQEKCSTMVKYCIGIDQAVRIWFEYVFKQVQRNVLLMRKQKNG